MNLSGMCLNFFDDIFRLSHAAYHQNRCEITTITSIDIREKNFYPYVDPYI